MLLERIAHFTEASRGRATYFQQKRTFPPAFVRRFMLRYPHAHLYAVFGLCCSAMIAPVLHSCYLYATMSREEFDRYRIDRNALVLERQKFGKGLWIPFVSSSNEQPSVSE